MTSQPHYNTWRSALSEQPIAANDDAPECGNCAPINWHWILAMALNACCWVSLIALVRFTFGGGQ